MNLKEANLKSAKTKLALLAALFSGVAFSSSVTVSPNEPSGKIRTIVSQPANKLFRVSISEIDGVLINNSNNAYWLAPGMHKIKLVPIFEHQTGTIKTTGKKSRTTHPLFELDVKEGRTYTLAAKLEGSRLYNWTAVVHKDEATK